MASYADIESKYVGNGPKNLKSLFESAIHKDAVLFIDEADTFLSKRVANVSSGSEQGINAMRSQLLIELEKFQGIALFATNLIGNYDPAFETRIKSIEFPLPDHACRERLWDYLLVNSPPLSFNKAEMLSYLSENSAELCEREIKNVILISALKTCSNKIDRVEIDLLIAEINIVEKSRYSAMRYEGEKIKSNEGLTAIIKEKLKD